LTRHFASDTIVISSDRTQACARWPDDS